MLSWETRADRWLVHGPAASLSVSRRTGHLLTWSLETGAGSVPVLADPLRPNYWRALTDNDRGYGNFDSRAQQVLVDTRWRDAAPVVSAGRMTPTPEGLRLSLRLGCPLFAEGSLDYLFTPDGEVVVSHTLVPDREMYRLGLTLRLPSADTVRWYGKGPHENYVDRNRSAFTAVHELPLADMVHRYVRPQENGNRTEVRWLEVAGPEVVLRAEDVTGGLLGFTAWPWTQQRLDEVEHDHELVAEPAVTVNIDRRQRGVGGDLPGVARLLPAYTIPRAVRAEVVVRLRARPVVTGDPLTSAE